MTQDWQPIETFPTDTKWQMATMVLCGHAEKKWVRFGRYYGELRDSVRRQPDMFKGLLDADTLEMDAECGLWCAEVA